MARTPFTCRGAAALVTPLLVLGLVACGGGSPEPATAPSPTPTTRAPTPTPTPSPEVEPQQTVVIPECEDANDLAWVEYGEYLEIPHTTARASEADRAVFDQFAGPVARDALDSATDFRGCYWPLYIAGNDITQYFAVLPPEVRDNLIAGLRDSDYGEGEFMGWPTFKYSIEHHGGYQSVGAMNIWYAFVDNLWIAIFDTGKSGSDYLSSALDALWRANPYLDDARP